MKPLYIITFSIFTCITLNSQSNTELFDYNSSDNSLAEVVFSRQIDSLIKFEKVVLEGFDSKVPFYHYSNSKKKKSAYIILLHGLSDNKDDWVYPSEPYLDWSKNLTSIKDSLLTLGYSLIIPDVKYHGERSYELDFRPPETLPPVISRNEADSKLFETLISATVKDLRMIMDYIDANSNGKPIFGAIGYSLGGNLSILLSMFDDRITTVVACVPPINLPARGLEQFEWSDDIIQGQIDITPMTHVSSLSTPTMMLMGKTDYFSPEEDVSNFFNGISISEKELKYFESGHILPDNYRLDAIRWISTYINLED